MTRYTAYEVVGRLRATEGIDLISFHTPAGLDQKIDVSLSSMNSDHSIIARVEINQVRGQNIHFQLVVIHSDFYGQRKLRIINLCLQVLPDMNTFYRSINCEALCLYSFRSIIDNISVTDRETLRTDLISLLANIVKEYRKSVQYITNTS